MNMKDSIVKNAYGLNEAVLNESKKVQEDFLKSELKDSKESLRKFAKRGLSEDVMFGKIVEKCIINIEENFDSCKLSKSEIKDLIVNEMAAADMEGLELKDDDTPESFAKKYINNYEKRTQKKFDNASAVSAMKKSIENSGLKIEPDFLKAALEYAKKFYGSFIKGTVPELDSTKASKKPASKTDKIKELETEIARLKKLLKDNGINESKRF